MSRIILTMLRIDRKTTKPRVKAFQDLTQRTLSNATECTEKLWDRARRMRSPAAYPIMINDL